MFVFITIVCHTNPLCIYLYCILKYASSTPILPLFLCLSCIVLVRYYIPVLSNGCELNCENNNDVFSYPNLKYCLCFTNLDLA